MNGDAPGDGGAAAGRAEVDTSAPFRSVREAVDHFKRIFAPPPKKQEESEHLTNLEEQTAQLGRELSVKEKETLDVLKELESTKKFIADLKLKIQSEEAAAFSVCAETARTAEPEERQSESAEVPTVEQHTENAATSVDEQLQRSPLGCSVLKDLERAKANLNRTTADLAAIRASVDSLRKEIAKEKILVERCREKVCSGTTLISSLEDELGQTKQKLQTLREVQMRREDPSDIFMEIKKMTSELEQLRNAAKASKSEAVVLAAEIEQMKASIGTAEVRCLAAKKIEEAARAAEALALAEIKILLLSNEASAEDLQVSLSAQEYSDLAAKALEADEILRKKVEAAVAQVDEASESEFHSHRRLEEAQLQVDECKKTLQDALMRVDAAKQGKIAVEEALRRCTSATGHNRRSLHEPPRFKHAARRCRNSLHEGSLKPTLSIGQILNRRRAVVYSTDGTTADKKQSGKRKKFAFTGLSVFLAKQAKSKKKKGSHSN